MRFSRTLILALAAVLVFAQGAFAQSHVVTIGHDGTNYDSRLSDGTPNHAPRKVVSSAFYADHGDWYDFLVVYTNFEYEAGEVLGFYQTIRNDVEGIGRDQHNNAALWGSEGRLQGYIDMRHLEQLMNADGTPDMDLSLRVLDHEIGHRWLSFVNYIDGGGQESADIIMDEEDFS